MKTNTKLTDKSWPRHLVKLIDVRERDFIIRVTNWLDDEDEPGYDVECYINGVYDWNESKCFTLHSGLTPEQAREHAARFAQSQTAKLLK
jgi:hypothetical protein